MILTTCRPGISSWWQLQQGTEPLVGTHSSSCSEQHNHDHEGRVGYDIDDFDDVVVVVGDDEDDEDHLNGPLEESFARLARENAVVEPGDFVTAHLQQKNISHL